MNNRSFQPGVRLSALDIVVLALGAIVGGGFGVLMFWPGMAILFVVGHFFLFCNVVRMERRSELVWAAFFVGLSAVTTAYGVPNWPQTFVTSLLVTAVLVAREVCKPSYHGAFWRWINPGLMEWWEKVDGGGGGVGNVLPYEGGSRPEC